MFCSQICAETFVGLPVKRSAHLQMGVQPESYMSCELLWFRIL